MCKIMDIVCRNFTSMSIPLHQLPPQHYVNNECFDKSNLEAILPLFTQTKWTPKFLEQPKRGLY